jgi:DNA-binding transcriptional MerR regulator
MSQPDELASIPDKIYFTIGEVAKLCQVEPHVLRYWEQEFSQLTPSKRRKRRYYQRKDVILVRRIKHLLYEERFSIKGARRQLESVTKPDSPSGHKNSKIKQAIHKLESVLEDLG